MAYAKFKQQAVSKTQIIFQRLVLLIALILTHTSTLLENVSAFKDILKVMLVGEASALLFARMGIIMGRAAYLVRLVIMDGISSKHAIHVPVIVIPAYPSFRVSNAKLDFN
jgi:hypothetical protein